MDGAGTVEVLELEVAAEVVVLTVVVDDEVVGAGAM